ncbi:MAG: ABC transporter substrate-binding protein, partial [Cocleimonas sp.]|nr:ABC transporter substrate-binding protein [Cocleimonas sp.]
MNKLVKSLSVALVTTVLSVNAMAKDELNVAYFLEWPSANQVAQVEKTYDEKMGMKVNWRSFDDGNAMTAAMVSGDIDIAYSQGFVPFVIGVTKGVDLKLVGVAMTYAENDNCVVHKDAKITKDNAKDLEGKKVALFTAGVTHYKMLKTLKHLKVDVSKVKILSMSNPDAAAAMARGDVTMACGFGGALTRMKEYGTVLMTGAEQEAMGLKVFDIVAVTGKFAKEHPKLITQFMQVTEDANKAYAKKPEQYYDILA